MESGHGSSETKKINGWGLKVNEPPDLQGRMHTAKLKLCAFNNSKMKETVTAVLLRIPTYLLDSWHFMTKAVETTVNHRNSGY